MGVRKEALHIASSRREPDSEVPQRVMPITPHPRLSKALEQQLFTQLLVALMSNSSRPAPRPATPVAPPRSPAPAPPPVSICITQMMDCLIVGVPARCGEVDAILHTSAVVPAAPRGSSSCSCSTEPSKASDAFGSKRSSRAAAPPTCIQTAKLSHPLARIVMLCLCRCPALNQTL
jgi:hypothetical protein